MCEDNIPCSLDLQLHAWCLQMFGAHFFLFFETGGKAEPVARKTQGALVDEAPVLQS